MKKIVIRTMIEVLSILAIATKEIDQCRMNGSFMYEYRH
jgi:hypothetical protein